tara:strand:+ start:359 stop:475 length:117 start_codon:yes stop_codon:yes gene_type:complete
MKIKIEIELDTLRDADELQSIVEIIEQIRERTNEEDDD